VPVVVDASPASCALVGILSGLLALERPLGVFLAVDLPHVPVALLQRLVSLAESADVVVPVSPDGPEPLCAVYSRDCLEPVRAALARGDLKMTGFWSGLRVRRLDSAELRDFGDPARLFLNLNAPADYERARS
jgi:molybdopterin-guanine dinucleotide biosynthesis protein A